MDPIASTSQMLGLKPDCVASGHGSLPTIRTVASSFLLHFSLCIKSASMLMVVGVFLVRSSVPLLR